VGRGMQFFPGNLPERDDMFMREVSWNVFTVTGNIEAYLLYKECCLNPETEEVHTVMSQDYPHQDELEVDQA
jgi:hypothetical protein